MGYSLNRFTNPERLIRTRAVQTRTGLTKPLNLADCLDRWILSRFAKPCVSVALWIGCNFGSEIGLPDWRELFLD